MKRKKLLTVLAAMVILALGVGIGAYAASNYGTQSDPLVAKSYLDNVLTPQLQQQFQAQLDESVSAMEQQIAGAASSGAANFASVSLGNGQTLTGDAGCEIILRTGSATVIGSSGLADVTDGVMLSAGSAVTQNHLLTIGGNGSGLTAASATTLLVRGAYSVK